MLKKFVEAGVAKIVRHQHDDGAFSLWPGSHAQPLGDGKAGKRIRDAGQEHLWWYYSDDTRTTAIALSSLLVAAPDHALIPDLAKGLLAMREGGRWDNTQDNLFSLVALADYARLKAPSDRAQSVAVVLDGKTVV